MLYLIQYVLCVTAFSQVLRQAQKGGRSTLTSVAINYFVASLVALGVSAVRGYLPWSQGAGSSVGMGAIGGLCLFGLVNAVLASYRHAGVAITGALFQSAAVIPVVASVWLWDEALGLARVVALLLLPMAMGLLRPKGPRPGPEQGLGAGWALGLVVIFAGLVLSLHKYAQVSF